MRYRSPIFERIPIIKRTSIVRRVPIILRHAIFQRTAIQPHYTAGIGCEDNCTGTVFGEPHDENAKFLLFRFTKGTEVNWDEQIGYAKAAAERKQVIKVVTDILLPSDFVYAVGYSSKNVVQYEVDSIRNTEIPVELRKNMKLCKDSGLFVAVILYSLLPTVIHSYDVLLILDSLKYVCSHICLKFYEGYPKKLLHNKKYCVVMGHVIPIKYMKYKSGHLQCSDDFIQKFLEVVEKYAVPNKLKYSVCNTQSCYWEGINGTN